MIDVIPLILVLDSLCPPIVYHKLPPMFPFGLRVMNQTTSPSLFHFYLYSFLDLLLNTNGKRKVDQLTFKSVLNSNN